MPSSATPRLRLEKQFTGENINVWGDMLNRVFDRQDEAIAGLVTVALTADVALTSTNYVEDQARYAMLKFTGTGAFTVTVPSVTKPYKVWNACTGAVTLTTGAGDTVAVASGEIAEVMVDGTNVKRVQGRDMGGAEILNLADPVSAQSAATRAFVLAQAWAVSSGSLPGQGGKANKFLKTDGTNPDWEAPVVAEIADYSSDQTTRHAATLAAATDIAAAFGAAL